MDNEEGVLDCACGSEVAYIGWGSPETIAWFRLHEETLGHSGVGATITKDCDCGLIDHPNGCAPAGAFG